MASTRPSPFTSPVRGISPSTEKKSCALVAAPNAVPVELAVTTSAPLPWVTTTASSRSSLFTSLVLRACARALTTPEAPPALPAPSTATTREYRWGFAGGGGGGAGGGVVRARLAGVIAPDAFADAYTRCPATPTLSVAAVQVSGTACMRPAPTARPPTALGGVRSANGATRFSAVYRAAVHCGPLGASRTVIVDLPAVSAGGIVSSSSSQRCSGLPSGWVQVPAFAPSTVTAADW